MTKVFDGINSKKILKIAFLGARGIPACYSGYDTLVDELSRALVKSGEAKVVVYCRAAYYKARPDFIDGVRLIYLPAPRIKALESLLHSFFSAIHVLCQKVDIIYFVDPANAPFCILLRLLGKKVLIHTDGLGWKRRKWGQIARRYYKFVEWLSARFISVLITDNFEMRNYYFKEYNAYSTYIPYGAKNYAGINEYTYSYYCLKPKEYILVVARLERENNTDLIIREYIDSGLTLPLVIVGDSPYDPKYWALLHKIADKRIRFLGRIDDQQKLNALYRGAFLYIHGHEVGGTNPSLLRAMNYSTLPVVINVPFNISVVEKGGIVFNKKKGHLSSILKNLMHNPEKVKELGKFSKMRADSEFTWKRVVEEHLKLFKKFT